MRQTSLMLTIIYVGCVSATAIAQETNWTGSADSNFANADNWNAGLPDNFDTIGVIDGGSNLPVMIASDLGEWEVGAIQIGLDVDGGGSLVQNGGVLNIIGLDTDAKTVVGSDALDPSSWVLNNDATVYYDEPFTDDGFDTDGNGIDFRVGHNSPEDGEGTLELHDNAVIRISDDLKVGDGSSGHGNVIIDGNASITVGSGISASGVSNFELSGNALLVSGNSAGPGDSDTGRTNEGYLTLSEEPSVLVRENAKVYVRTLQQRDGVAMIELEDNAEFHVFDVFEFATPDLGVATVVGEAQGAQRTSHVSQNSGAETSIFLSDSAIMSVDSDLEDSSYSGFALSGGTNRGANSGGGITTIDVRDAATFAVEQDLNMTFGTGFDAESTLSIRGGDASVSVNGDLRMSIDEFGEENDGVATLEAVITGNTHTTVNVGGAAEIGNGGLAVKLDGYTPVGGETYRLIAANSVTSTAFRDVSLPPLPGELEWMLAIDATSVVLSVSGGVACDINGDGVCDASDIDAMTQRVMDGEATQADRKALIDSPFPAGLNSWVGDSDQNGQFDEQDFVKVFIEGKYLTGEKAIYVEGDWDGNFLADEQDFVAAFIAGGYLKGQRGAVSAVPEPSSLVLLALSGLALIRRRR